ncbi:amino acid permease [Formicincola oecophyllae]|nr:amino acid permease [Formicincola oecophyllae]
MNNPCPPAPPLSGSDQAPEGQSVQDKLASFHVAMISLGGIIGAGLFVGTSATISSAGPAVLLSYGGAGLAIALVMRLLGDLAIHARGRGSFISHTRHWLGPRAAFTVGWSYALLWAITAGAQAVAGGLLLEVLCGLAPLWGAVAFIAVAWGLNRLSLRHYGRSETFLSLLKLGFLGFFMVLGLGWLFSRPHPLQLAWHNLAGHGGIMPLGGWAVVAVIPMIVQSFSGCEIAIIAAGDSEKPMRSIARTVEALPWRVLFFYAGSVAVIVTLLPWQAVRPGTSPFLTVMNMINLPGASMAAVVVTLVAVMSCLNSSVYVVSRTLRELAASSLAPERLCRARRPGDLPTGALNLTTLLEMAVVATGVESPAHVYPLLLGASGGIIVFVYFMVALAAWRLARNLFSRVASGLCVMLFPILALMLGLLPQSRQDTALSLGVVLVVGFCAWWFAPQQKK